MPVLDTLTRALTRFAAPPPPAAPLPPAYRGKAAALDNPGGSTWVLTDPSQPEWIRPPAYGTTYGGEINYTAAAGDLLSNSAVMACIGWLISAEPGAPWRIQRRDPSGDSPLPAHPLLALLQRPNPYYSGLALRQATVLSFNLAGNAYWLKVRNARKQVVELWYEPHFSIRAVYPRDGSAWITGYQVYRLPGAVIAGGGVGATGYGQWVDWPLEDVVHFRNGLDPVNPRYGLSPLAAALRAIATDNEAARFAYTMLRNTGVGSVVISPKFEGDVWDAETRARVFANFQRATTGDHRGEPVIASGAMDFAPMAFSPEAMNADTQHRQPESRIAALLSTPAEVVGLLVGMEHKTYDNVAEAKDSIYTDNLVPYWRAIDDTLTQNLLPDFGDPAREYVDHDLSGVPALAALTEAARQDEQDDLTHGRIALNEYRARRGLPDIPGGELPQLVVAADTALWTRYGAAIRSGLLTPNEARAKVGEPPLTDPAADKLHLESARPGGPAAAGTGGVGLSVNGTGGG